MDNAKLVLQTSLEKNKHLFNGSDSSYQLIVNDLSNGATVVAENAWAFDDGSILTNFDLQKRLMTFLMELNSDYGAADSEGYHAYERVISTIEEGNEIVNWAPYYTADWWQLYGGFDDSFPRREEVASQLGAQARRLYTAGIREKFGV